MDYVREKLWEAIYSLVGDGTVQERLSYAMQSLILLKEDEIPQQIRDDFVFVKKELTKHPAEREGEGTIHSSTRKLTNEDGTKFAQKIPEMYTAVRGGI